MPGNLRNRVVLFMYKDTIAKIRLFQTMRDGHQDVAFVVDIAKNFEPFYGESGDIVVNQGDVVDDAIFVAAGKLEFFRAVKMQPHMVDVATGKPMQPNDPVGKLGVRLVDTQPVTHGYVHEGYHALAYNCMQQTPSQISLKASSKSHLLSIRRQFLLEMPVLHSHAHMQLKKEAQQQEESITKAINIEEGPSDEEGRLVKASLCMNYKIVTHNTIATGGKKQSVLIDEDSYNPAVQILTRRNNPNTAGIEGASEYIEGPEFKIDLKARWIIDPNNFAKLQWDLFVGFLIVYGFITLPLAMAFPASPECGETDYNLIIDWLVDIFFITDIVVNFRTAVYCEDSDLYDTRLSAIANEYVPGWFMIDLPSSLPVTQILEMATSSCGNAADAAAQMEEGPDGELVPTARGGGNASGAKLVKLIRMARLIRLMKLARVLKLGKSFGALSEFMESSAAFRSFLKLTVALFVVAHYFGCMWHIVTNEVRPWNFRTDG
jgi:hypothetical protein